MGYKILEKRKAEKLSQEELAKRSGVSRSIISDLETGKRTEIKVGTLRRIAGALNCTVTELFF